MKKTILIIAMAALCLNFESSAQQLKTPTYKIGDRIPDITIKNILNTKGSTLRLSDYRGQLLIIDFWATWCSPCVAMIPRMDSLQKQFAGKLAFLPVTTQSKETVQNFYQKLNRQRSSALKPVQVVADSQLDQMFPHRTLPHYVWIDGSSTVRAITEFNEITASRIQTFLETNQLDVQKKEDQPAIAYQNDKPLLVNGNGGDGQGLIYHSVMTGYNSGLPLQRVIQKEPNGGYKILCKNLNVLQLLATAYADQGKDYLFNLDSIKLKVRDPQKLTSNAIGMAYDQWLQSGNGYCYELIIPAALKKDAFAIMRKEMEKLFPAYAPSMQSKTEACLILQQIDPGVMSRSKGGESRVSVDAFGADLNNAYLKQWVDQVNVQRLTTLPILDRSGIKDRIDLKISNGFKDTKVLNQELRSYGLQLIAGTRTVPLLIVEDR